MSFTDDDLKRLKEMMEAYDPRLKLPALLARLEASEAANHRVLASDPAWVTYPEFKAWRKAAGKV